MLNPNNIGINVFQIADYNDPKYYFLDVNIENGSNGNFDNISVSISSNEVALCNSVRGTMEEIEEQLKYYVWNNIKDYESIRIPFKKIELPTDVLLSDRITSLHRLLKISMFQARNIISQKSFRIGDINNVIMHSEALNYLIDEWGFNIGEKLEIGVSINNNLPRHRMVFNCITDDKISEGNTCIVYKKIEHNDQTFSVLFSIIALNKNTFVSVDIPSRIFRKNKIEELL